MSPKETAYIVERLAVRFMAMVADYERKLVEHRDSFGARTSADAKIIEGLRRELAEVAALQARLRASIARGDFAQIEVAQLKAQTPKRSHPVKVGEWVRRTSEPYGGVSIGTIGKVLGFAAEHYSIAVEQCWYFKYCEPCDPPEASHDTPAGKEAAKAVIRDSQMTEIKVGDMAKVVGASGDLTAQSDIGKIGEVLQLDSMDGTVLLSGGAGWVDHRDVRKVTT